MSGRRSKTASTSDSSFLLQRQSKNPFFASSVMNCCNALHDVDAILIPRELAAGVEQLLEDLIVRCELDRNGEVELGRSES
jgi:hypothetical protein